MQKITTWLWFDTEAEEAATFYTSVFPDARITDVSHYGAAGPRPEGMVMTVGFELFGREFYALNGGSNAKIEGPGISFMVECESQEEVDRYWSKFGRRRAGDRLRLGDRPLRPRVADHPEAADGAAGGSRPREGAARHGRDAEDDEDRDRRARACGSRLT